MAIDDLPGPVVNFLNVIGVPWPYIDEDTVTQFAALMRDFGQAVQTTHQDASAAVEGIAQAHQGASTEQMQSGWKQLSAQHVDELVSGCGVLADALDAAASYIVVQKGEAIATLIGMAATFAAVEGARLLMKSLVMDLQQYIIGKVIEAAAKPLFAKVEDAMTGLDWSKSGTAARAADGFMIDPAAVRTQTSALRTHAATIRTHGAIFQQGMQGLNF